MSLPVKVLIGYLPDVSRRDAENYVKGAARSNFESLADAYWHLEPFNQGFAYEAHEGGDRGAFLPSILPMLGQSAEPVYIQTATRTVQVDPDQGGLSAVWLPEAEVHETTPGVLPGIKMKRVEPDSREWVYAGGMLFLAGVVGMALGLSASLVAATAYRDAQAVSISARAPAYELPYAQWAKLEVASQQGPVAMLKFDKGVWQPIQATRNAPPSPLPPGNNQLRGAAGFALAVPGLVPRPIPPGNPHKGAKP